MAKPIEAGIATGRVRHLGHVDDIGTVYSQSDAFVFPTFEEGGPQVTYEAAAFGLPCVTTPMGGARLVKTGRTGTLVPPGDSDSLTEALRSLADDRELCRRMGSSAKEAVRDFEYATVSRQRAKLLKGAVKTSEY